MKNSRFPYLYDGRKSQRIAGFFVYVGFIMGLLSYSEGSLPVPFWVVVVPTVLWALWYVSSILIRLGGSAIGRAD